VGRLELEIPKLRQGSFLPSLLEPRRRIERALWVVIQEAWVHGASTRKVDDLVAAMGGCHVSKSEVSRICSELDLELALFRERPLDDAQYPYVWFDATYEKVRQGGRIVSQAVVLAMAIRESGEKCVLGVAVGASETEAFWREFCRQLVARGLSGVVLVISDAHEGLRSALAQCFAGASWQRCPVHFLRNVVAACSRQDAPAVLALVKTVFAPCVPAGGSTNRRAPPWSRSERGAACTVLERERLNCVGDIVQRELHIPRWLVHDGPHHHHDLGLLLDVRHGDGAVGSGPRRWDHRHLAHLRHSVRGQPVLRGSNLQRPEHHQRVGHAHPVLVSPVTAPQATPACGIGGYSADPAGGCSRVNSPYR
jgi:hypothetical protein